MGGLVIICWQCDDSGWVCESHPKRPWEGSMHVAAVRLECPAQFAIQAIGQPRRGCRRALSTMRTAVRGIESTSAPLTSEQSDMGRVAARLKQNTAMSLHGPFSDMPTAQTHVRCWGMTRHRAGLRRTGSRAHGLKCG
jgi:hypothetical protein